MKNLNRNISTYSKFAQLGFLVVLLLVCFTWSCSDQEQFPEKKTEESLIVENRGGDCDIPDWTCFPPVQYAISDDYLGCQFRIHVFVTKCINPITGDAEYFFEEDALNITNPAVCTLSSEVLNNFAFDLVVATLMNNLGVVFPGDEVADCAVNETTITQQIKLNCATWCSYYPLGGAPGQIAFEYRDCSDGESCCLTTKKWCVSSLEVVTLTFEENEPIGSCESSQESCTNVEVVGGISYCSERDRNCDQ